MSKKKIRAFVEELEIPYLVHFTHIDNLEDILENGLISRDQVDELPQDTVVNDELRLDGRTNSISLSIAHPNDKMFYKYRENDADWCVLGIRKSVMWEHDCLFYKHNAASGNVSGLSTAYLASPESLASMFDEMDCLDSRDAQCLKDFDPTDVQAEILVKDHIPPEDIFGIVVSNRQVKKRFSGSDEVKIKLDAPNKGMYATRLYRRKYQ